MKYKNFSRLLAALFIVIMVMVSAVANAQLELVYGLVANKLLANSEKSEHPSATILVNVTLVKANGSRVALPGIDTSISQSVAFDVRNGGDIQFELVLATSASKSPRETRFYVNGVLVDAIPFKGGRRQGEKITDNAGTKRPCLVNWSDLYDGWNTFTLVQGNAVGTWRCQKVDYTTLAGLMGDEEARHALLGYGQSAYPAMPTFGALVGDKLLTAASGQELEQQIGDINADLQQKAKADAEAKAKAAAEEAMRQAREQAEREEAERRNRAATPTYPSVASTPPSRPAVRNCEVAISVGQTNTVIDDNNMYGFNQYCDVALDQIGLNCNAVYSVVRFESDRPFTVFGGADGGAGRNQNFCVQRTNDGRYVCVVFGHTSTFLRNLVLKVEQNGTSRIIKFCKGN